MNAYLERELRLLRDEWPALVDLAPDVPTFTWEDLKEELLANAQTQGQELVIRGALSALLKMSRFKPAACVLGEILMLASSVADLTSPCVPEGDELMP